MSALGTALDALEALALGLGIHASRAPRLAEKLETNELPHLLLGPFLTNRRELDYMITAHSREIGAALISRAGSQETAYELLDTLRAALIANPTLGGQVERAWISRELPSEDPNVRERTQEFILTLEAFE
jgi:hypothetical protein